MTTFIGKKVQREKNISLFHLHSSASLDKSLLCAGWESNASLMQLQYAIKQGSL